MTFMPRWPTLVMLGWLALAAPAQTVSTPPLSGHELLERAAQKYRSMGAYKELLKLRVVVVTEGDTQVVENDTCELTFGRPAKLRVRPSSASLRGTVLSDGESVWLHDPAAARFAKIPAKVGAAAEFWDQLLELNLASIVWMSLPGLFFFHTDPLGSLEESYGANMTTSRRASVGETAETAVVSFTLDGDVQMNIELDSATFLIRRWRIQEPVKLEGGRAGQRVLTLDYVAPEADPALGEATWKFEPPVGSAEVGFEELTATLVDRGTFAGRLFPDFMAPAVQANAEPLTRGLMAGHTYLVTFLQSWDDEAALYMARLAAAASSAESLAPTGPPAPRLAVVAMDEDVDAASLRLIKLEGVDGYLDPGGVIAQSIGLVDPLTTFLVGEDGQVQAELHGPPPAEELNRLLAALAATAKNQKRDR